MEVEWIFQTNDTYHLTGHGEVASGRIIYASGDIPPLKGVKVLFLYQVNQSLEMECKGAERYCVGGESPFNVVGLLFPEGTPIHTDQIIVKKKDEQL